MDAEDSDTEIRLLSLEERVCSLNNIRDVFFARITELQAQVEVLEKFRHKVTQIRRNKDTST